ncbi:hypothetical protein Tco_0125398, partial [Tanacetum coccineum]
MAPQDSSSVTSHSSPVVKGTQAEKEELASLERQEHEANAEAERLGLEFVHAVEDLVFSAAKSFQTPSTNAVTPVTPLTPGTPITPASAPFATSTSPDILSAGASSLRYPHPSTFANEFATGIPILKDIYENPGAAEDQGERPAEPADQPPIPAPILSPVNVPNEPDEEPLTSTFVEDETTGGSFHEATPFAGQPSGVAKDPLTLTALSSLVSKFMQKTTSFES